MVREPDAKVRSGDITASNVVVLTAVYFDAEVTTMNLDHE